MRHDNTTALETAQRSLARLGMRTIETTGRDAFSAESRLLRIETFAERHRLRLSCRLLSGVARNKIALWNIIHHNNAAIPFGQFFITEDNVVTFGAQVPQAGWVEVQLTEIYYQLLLVAEAYYKMIGNDFTSQPFAEEEIQVNVMDLFKSEFVSPIGDSTPSFGATAEWLADQLSGAAGKKSALQVSEHEFAITDEDNLISLQLVQMPRILKSRNNHEWVLAMQTEVGVLQKTDDALWVMFNRLNYESSLVSYSIRYERRKPIVTLRTALTPTVLTDTNFLAYAIEQHSLAAPTLYNALEKPYNIRSLVGENLGL